MSTLLKKSYAALFNKGDFSVSEVADKISEEFEIGRGKDLISAENLALLVTELACERISSRTALVTLNQPPVNDPQEARKKIDDLCFDRFDQLLKISSRTKESNVARATQLPSYAEFALYVAHVRLLERDGKNPLEKAGKASERYFRPLAIQTFRLGAPHHKITYRKTTTVL